jgi:hypothetical protein
MGRVGLKFYRSEAQRVDSGPDGIIGADDVVLIKVNAQWECRGMTNTDVVRGVIRRILDHPDGFIGEVVIVEQAQQTDYLTNVEERLTCVEVLMAELSPALGVHTGPGTAGVCYFPV